jgi:hypothetical protein
MFMFYLLANFYMPGSNVASVRHKAESQLKNQFFTAAKLFCSIKVISERICMFLTAVLQQFQGCDIYGASNAPASSIRTSSVLLFRTGNKPYGIWLSTNGISLT